MKVAVPRRRIEVARLGARRELVLLVGFGLALLLVVGIGATFASRSVAQTQALEDSERMTRRLAELVIAPLLPSYLEKDPSRLGELDRAVQNRMSDGYLTEVTVWKADGTVVYSDKEEEIGEQVVPVPAEVTAAIAGQVTSGFEDGAPEAEQGAGYADQLADGGNRYVEVYVPFSVEGMEPMAFEAYFNYQRVDEVADRLLRRSLPLVLGSLVILQLVQLPVVVSLGRRLRRHEEDRSRLLERALTASDQERVRFAADLHDGPIQDLAGIGYALGAIAPVVPAAQAPLMDRLQTALGRSIASLRGLMTDLYPPDLRSGNVEDSIDQLAEQLRADGVVVDLVLSPLPVLGDETLASLYRVAREALTNARKHAQASRVVITLGPVTSPASAERVQLVVTDDGVGVDPSRLDRRAEGHLGLRLLTERVHGLGGELAITSAPGLGTTVSVELPAGATADPTT